MKNFVIGALALVIFLIMIALCSKRNIMGKVFVCPHCRQKFVQKKWKNVYFSNMANNSAFLKCPHCKKYGICNESRVQE